MIPWVFEDSDGVTLEWVKKDRRFGLLICENPEESGWYYVSRDGDMIDQKFSLEWVVWMKKFFEG